MKKIIVLSMLLVLIGLSVNSLFSKEEASLEVAQTTPVLSERAVPNQQLLTLDGQQEALYDYLGKPTILVFWASWCIPCNEELPEVQQFYDTYQQQVHVLAMNATDTEAGKQKVEQHVANKQWTFPVMLDESGAIRKAFGAFTVPTTIFLSATGELVHEVYGPIDAEYMQKIVEAL